MARILLIICLVAAAFVCAGELSSRTEPPRVLRSDDFLWRLLARCEIKMDQNFSCSINYISEVKALNGKQVALGGFMVPLEAKERCSHFLLSRRAPSCAFCPPAEPNEIVEVFSAKPMRWQEDLVTFSGSLVLPSGGEKGVFFQLKDARSGNL